MFVRGGLFRITAGSRIPAHPLDQVLGLTFPDATPADGLHLENILAEIGVAVLCTPIPVELVIFFAA